MIFNKENARERVLQEYPNLSPWELSAFIETQDKAVKEKRMSDIIYLKQQGIPTVEIAAHYGISMQRLYQVIKHSPEYQSYLREKAGIIEKDTFTCKGCLGEYPIRNDGSKNMFCSQPCWVYYRDRNMDSYEDKKEKSRAYAREYYHRVVKNNPEKYAKHIARNQKYQAEKVNSIPMIKSRSAIFEAVQKLKDKWNA